MTFLISAPELVDHGGYFGAQFKVGDTEVFVFDIEPYGDQQGRTVMTAHDNDGNEVEIHFYPDNQCQDCGDVVVDDGHRMGGNLYCADCYAASGDDEDAD